MGNIIEWIGYPGIFGPAGILIINPVSSGKEPGILQQGALPDCLKNIGLVFLFQVNTFCIAAAFKIKNAIGRPAMLVIADKSPAPVRTQCGFTRAAQAKENCGIAPFPHIRSTVHAQHLLLHRQQIIQYGKNRFLYLSGIARPGQQNNLVF